MLSISEHPAETLDTAHSTPIVYLCQGLIVKLPVWGTPVLRIRIGHVYALLLRLVTNNCPIARGRVAGHGGTDR